MNRDNESSSSHRTTQCCLLRLATLRRRPRELTVPSSPLFYSHPHLLGAIAGVRSPLPAAAAGGASARKPKPARFLGCSAGAPAALCPDAGWSMWMGNRTALRTTPPERSNRGDQTTALYHCFASRMWPAVAGQASGTGAQPPHLSIGGPRRLRGWRPPPRACAMPRQLRSPVLPPP